MESEANHSDSSETELESNNPIIYKLPRHTKWEY